MPQKVGWHFLGFSFVYLANMSEIFGVNMEYGPLWSLAVEEHFYIGWPWVIRWLNLRGILIAATTVVIGSPIVRALTFSQGGAWNGTVRTWNSLDGLAMGALLAMAVRAYADQRRVAKLVAAGAAALAVAGLVVGWHHGILGENCDWIGKGLRATVENSVYLSVVCSVLVLGTSRFSRVANIGWLKFYGFISYGFYLVHVLILHVYDAVVGPPSANIPKLALRCGIVFVACTFLCWISRTTFEEWFLGIKEKVDGTVATIDSSEMAVATTTRN